MIDGPPALAEAIEDIDAYLQEMPAKADDWSIGYEAITPFVKSLRILRAEHARLTALEKDWDQYWRGMTFAEHVAIQKARPRE